MKALITTIAIISSLNAFSHRVSEKVVRKMVKEDIYQNNGRMLGVRYVDSLDFVSCDLDKCTFDYTYMVSGSAGEYDYDLTCTGKLVFDLNELETEPKNQECIDN